jgi:hypothetical protein
MFRDTYQTELNRLETVIARADDGKLLLRCMRLAVRRLANDYPIGPPLVLVGTYRVLWDVRRRYLLGIHFDRQGDRIVARLMTCNDSDELRCAPPVVVINHTWRTDTPGAFRPWVRAWIRDMRTLLRERCEKAVSA